MCPLSFCLFGIPQPQSSLYSSTGTQHDPGHWGSLAEHSSLLVQRSGICHSQLHSWGTALMTFPHPYKQHLSAGCWETLSHPWRWKGQSWRHLAAIAEQQLKPQSNLCTCTLPQSQQLESAGEALCFSHTGVASLLKQTPFLSPQASNLSLKEISVLFPKAPAKKKPLPFATASVFSSANWSLSLLPL